MNEALARLAPLAPGAAANDLAALSARIEMLLDAAAPHAIEDVA